MRMRSWIGSSAARRIGLNGTIFPSRSRTVSVPLHDRGSGDLPARVVPMSTGTRAGLSLLIGVVVATVICLFAGFRFAYIYVFAASPALLTVFAVSYPASTAQSS
jgi:hypothetical protein